MPMIDFTPEQKAVRKYRFPDHPLRQLTHCPLCSEELEASWQNEDFSEEFNLLWCVACYVKDNFTYFQVRKGFEAYETLKEKLFYEVSIKTKYFIVGFTVCYSEGDCFYVTKIERNPKKQRQITDYIDLNIKTSVTINTIDDVHRAIDQLKIMRVDVEKATLFL